MILTFCVHTATMGIFNLAALFAPGTNARVEAWLGPKDRQSSVILSFLFFPGPSFILLKPFDYGCVTIVADFYSYPLSFSK